MICGDARIQDNFVDGKASAMHQLHNYLIERLPRRHMARFLEKCQRFDLVPTVDLGSEGKVLSHAYFPCSGAIALVTDRRGQPPLVVGSVGSDSMLGAELLLGVVPAPWRSVVQHSGSCWRIEAEELRLVTSEIADLRTLLQKNFIVQVHQRHALALAKADPMLHQRSPETKTHQHQLSGAAHERG